MTKEERAKIEGSYLNTCARIGELLIAQEINESTVKELREQARFLLKQIRETKIEEVQDAPQ